MAEPLQERPAVAASSGIEGARGGPRVGLRQGLCLVQVIARRGREGDVGRVLGLPLPDRPNATTSDGDIIVFCLRPRDWLIVTLDPDGRRGAVAVEARRRLDGIAAAIDQSHGRVVLQLAGEGARALLQQGCNLDLEPAAFPPGAMAQAGIAGIAVLLHGVEREVFDLYVARSYAAGLARWLEHHGVRLEPDSGI